MVAFSSRGLLLLLLLVGFLYSAPKLVVPVEEPVIAKDTVAISDKKIAFSFDDTPRGPGAFLDKEERAQLLIQALESAEIEQAVFFINPGRITEHDNDADIVMAYAKAGHVLANHTAHHSKLASTSVQKFLADVDEAAEWLKEKPNTRPWFRFPHLDEGSKDKVKRDAIRKALRKRGLMNGYVTVDASDWYMEEQTLAASKTGKSMDKDALRDLFVESYLESANFSDDLARRTLNRAPIQMILLHDTDLAAMFVDDLAAALKKDGWQIVTADEAYRDPIAFMEPDVDFADGTRIQMLAAERKIGNRWYMRNDQKVAKKLFAERVLRD